MNVYSQFKSLDWCFWIPFKNNEEALDHETSRINQFYSVLITPINKFQRTKMPGITGIISKNLVSNEENNLKSMLSSMLHEDFYTHGTFVDVDNGWYIGHVSIEGSFSDCMPIQNEEKTLILFLTGECYFAEDELLELRQQGHQVNSSNAELLIHLYEQQGEKFFHNLNGWFNGIILDKINRRAILFNDRYGIRRIYYYENESAFYFSSEAKSLLKALPFLREADPRSIGEYLTYDCVLENRTFFSNIFLLPSGSNWIFSHGKVQKTSYFHPDSLENQPTLPKDQFLERLEYTFDRILPRYFSGPGIGMSLTGGLDTRMIMARRRPSPGELPCYTFGGTYRDTLDVRIAPKVADTCGQTHQVLEIDNDEYLNEYPSHVERSIYISDGLENVDKADVIYFSKLAREVAPVRMTGIYGSQVLNHISGLQERRPYDDLIATDFKPHLTSASATLAGLKKAHDLSFMLFSEIPWWWNGFISAQSSQVAVRSPYLDNDFVSLLYRVPPGLNNFSAEYQLNMIKTGFPELMSIPTTGSHGGSSSAIISSIKKQFLKLLILADKIYIRERIPRYDSATHWVGRIDHLLSPLHADRLIMGLTDFRRYRVWFRDQLSDYLKETLLCDRTFNRPYWNKEYLEKVVLDHTNGRGTYVREIRKVLQVEMIHRILLEDIR
jgi:asparagine synthase (glutamine-hydrolysing)